MEMKKPKRARIKKPAKPRRPKPPSRTRRLGARQMYLTGELIKTFKKKIKTSKKVELVGGLYVEVQPNGTVVLLADNENYEAQLEKYTEDFSKYEERLSSYDENIEKYKMSVKEYKFNLAKYEKYLAEEKLLAAKKEFYS